MKILKTLFFCVIAALLFLYIFDLMIEPMLDGERKAAQGNIEFSRNEE